MRRQLFGTLTLIALATPAAAALTASAARIDFQPESRLWIEGTSTVRGYKCQAGETRGTVATDPARAGLDLAGLQDAVRAVELAVPVAKLDCGNGTMDDHLRKALKAADHPEIRYRLSSYEVATPTAGDATLTLKGTLSIAGRENPITLSAVATPEAGGALRVKGSTQLRMTEYGVKPPSLMMGTMKVHDPVTVRFDMLLK